MFGKLKNKLKQIQEGDEKIKKRWIIMMSFLAMAAIIGVWVMYLNLAATTEQSRLSEKPEFNWEKEWLNFKEKISEAKNKIGDLNIFFNKNGSR